MGGDGGRGCFLKLEVAGAPHAHLEGAVGARDRARLADACAEGSEGGVVGRRLRRQQHVLFKLHSPSQNMPLRVAVKDAVPLGLPADVENVS